MDSGSLRISVIVPVYNTEKYLRRCIDSILNQTYEALEVILVDDGSTDGSGAVCDEYAEKDARVRVIHQKNGGISAARNAGIDAASGQYIAFIDSDDYLFPTMYGKLFESLQKTKADIAVCQWQYEMADGRQVVEKEKIDASLYGKKSAADFAAYLYRSGSYENGVVVSTWNKLYRCEVFQNLRFQGRLYEDDEISGIIFSHPYSVVVLEEQLYIYCQNPDSLTNKPFSQERLAFLSILDKRSRLFSNNLYLLQETQKLYCNIYIEFYFKSLEGGFSMPKSFRGTFRKMVRHLQKEHVCSLKFFARMYIFMLSPRVYHQIAARR
ncbi:glycosyltransferase family 2 protein [Dysosmobacter sp.]